MAMKPERIALDLVDQDGAPFTVDSLSGRYALAYFGFLHCRVVCPRTLMKMSEVLRLLGNDAEKFRVLYISVDPERDTPAAMKDFLQQKYPEFIGLTGSRLAVDAAKASMRVFARHMPDEEDPDGYGVPHTALVYLLDDQGRYRAHFAEHLEAAEIAARLRTLIG